MCVVVWFVGACQHARGGAGLTPATVVRPSTALPLEIAAGTAIVGSRDHPEHGPIAETWVTLRNLGSEPLQLTLGTQCTVFVRVFATPARIDPHAWSLGGYPGGCKWLPLPQTIAAGAVDTLRTRIPVAMILGDSLPARRVYYFSALVVIRELPQEHVNVPAGALRLAP